MPQQEQQQHFNRGIDTLMTGSMSMFELATHWQTEALRFMGRRMNDYVRTADRMRQCRSPGDVITLQTNFILQMLSDYQAEADKYLKTFMNLQTPARRALEGAFDLYEDSLRESQHIADEAENEDADEEQASGRRKKKSGQG